MTALAPPSTIAPTPVDAWLGQPLARFTYTDAKDNTLSHVTGPGASFDRFIDRTIKTRGPVFHPGGASFADAVQAANQLARESQSRPLAGTAQAYGVLQAADGAFHITALRSVAGSGRYGHLDERPDGTKVAHRIRVDALHPDLMAVVGKNEWINFSSEQITPGFVTPDPRIVR